MMEDAKEKEKKSVKQIYISILALTLMNVSIIAGIGNDVQQAFYGLSAVTYFAIGAICFFIPTALVAAELASGQFWYGDAKLCCYDHVLYTNV